MQQIILLYAPLQISKLPQFSNLTLFNRFFIIDSFQEHGGNLIIIGKKVDTSNGTTTSLEVVHLYNVTNNAIALKSGTSLTFVPILTCHSLLLK